MSQESEDITFIASIVTSLTGAVDCFTIKRSMDEKGVLIELSVDQPHFGRVVGRNGATAKAIRQLLRALGTKNDARYGLKISERNGTT